MVLQWSKKKDEEIFSHFKRINHNMESNQTSETLENFHLFFRIIIYLTIENILFCYLI